ncbi:lysophosphatidic acid receptor 4 [Ornithorhynchus anatinus]|uniref:Lysophosphatidic acid receptor 4 n=1 Tax=Ornithorhynchus anatinus TaxID=9258 RepID=A0A6I8P4H0_ORNAN|nr:lysophosphatidic acid receptor 4 [Ornithorhynchus anatinus]
MGTLGSNQTCVTDDSFKYPLNGVVYSVVFVLGLVTNCASLFVFCRRMSARSEATIFMTNLAMSDLLFVCTLPFKIFYNLNRHWPFGDPLCKVSGTVFLTNIYGSMLFLTCISVDRFLAIGHPFRSRTLRTRRNCALVCVAVWVLVLGGGISASFFSTTNVSNATTTCFEGFSQLTWKTYLAKITIFIEVVGFLIPLLLNLTCASLVLRTLRKPATLAQIGTNKEKVLKMIAVHVAVFVVCFVPYNSTLFLYALVRSRAVTSCTLERFARTMYPITLCVATLNCCFDPFIYYFTSEAFQKALAVHPPIRLVTLFRGGAPLSTKAVLPALAEDLSDPPGTDGRELMSESRL